MPMLTTLLMRLAGVAGPLAGAHPVGEGGHPVEHRVHVGHDVLAVDLDHGVARGPQRGVQHRAVLGGVDLLAREHRVRAARPRPRGGQLDAAARSVSSVIRCLE